MNRTYHALTFLQLSLCKLMKLGDGFVYFHQDVTEFFAKGLSVPPLLTVNVAIAAEISQRPEKANPQIVPILMA